MAGREASLASEAFWSMVLSGLLMSLLDLVLCSGPVRPVDVFQPCLNVSMSNFEFQYFSTKFLSTKTWSVLVFWTEEWLDTRSPIHWSALGGLFPHKRLGSICLTVGSAGSGSLQKTPVKRHLKILNAIVLIGSSRPNILDYSLFRCWMSVESQFQCWDLIWIDGISHVWSCLHTLFFLAHFPLCVWSFCARWRLAAMSWLWSLATA